MALFWSAVWIPNIHGFRSGPILDRHTRQDVTCLTARPKRTPSLPPIVSSTLQIPPSKITERLLQLTQSPNVAILIDAENIRGKTNFELSHSDLLDRLTIWASLRNHAHGRTIVVIDHGSQPTAHLLSCRNETGICVTFAGPKLKADDIIARDTQWLLQQSDVRQVIVITADRELSYRCRNANPSCVTKKEKRTRKKTTRKGRKMAITKQHELMVDLDSQQGGNETNDTTINSTLNITLRVNVIHSKRFLEDMEEVMNEWMIQTEAELSTDPQTSIGLPETTTNGTSVPSGKWHNLFELRAQILHLESCLRKKCTVRKRSQLTQEMRKCKARWEMELSSLGDVSDPEQHQEEENALGQLMTMSLSSTLSLKNPSQTSNTTFDTLATEEQKQLLLRWGQRRGSQKREETEDRIILAEMIRRQLIQTLDDTKVVNEEENTSLVELYSCYINNMVTA